MPLYARTSNPTVARGMRRVRLERGWSLDDVARLFGCHVSQISRIENSKRSPPAAPVAAGVLGVRVEYLIAMSPLRLRTAIRIPLPPVRIRDGRSASPAPISGLSTPARPGHPRIRKTIINPSGHGTPAPTGANSAPRVLAAKTGTPRTPAPKTKNQRNWHLSGAACPKPGQPAPSPPVSASTARNPSRDTPPLTEPGRPPDNRTPVSGGSPPQPRPRPAPQQPSSHPAKPQVTHPSPVRTVRNQSGQPRN